MVDLLFELDLEQVAAPVLGIVLGKIKIGVTVGIEGNFRLCRTGTAAMAFQRSDHSGLQCIDQFG